MNDFRCGHPARVPFGKAALEHLPVLRKRPGRAYSERTRGDVKAGLRMAL